MKRLLDRLAAKGRTATITIGSNKPEFHALIKHKGKSAEVHWTQGQPDGVEEAIDGLEKDAGKGNT